jgi:23S rRNA (adenine2030-N6)-methyltransferase
MKDRPHVRTLCADGYDVAARQAPQTGRLLVLIDPPFEQPDDYLRITRTISAVRKRNKDAIVLVWLPLKDLETFDAFLRGLDAPALVAEARMRPLDNPMKMNGCALVLVGGPDMSGDLEALCAWTTGALGENGAGRVYRL